MIYNKTDKKVRVPFYLLFCLQSNTDISDTIHEQNADMPSVTDCYLHSPASNPVLALGSVSLLPYHFPVTLASPFPLSHHYPIFSLATPYTSMSTLCSHSTANTPVSISGETGWRAGQCKLREYSEPGKQHGKER